MANNKKIAGIVKDYFILFFGCLIYSLSWTQIFVPSGIISGGITGLCTVIQYGTGFKLAYSYTIVNAVLLVIGFKVLGKSFGFRTVFAMAVIAMLLDVLPTLGLPNLILKDAVLNPVLAAIMESVGITILLAKGGSSGGTDIIAMIMNKYWPITPGTVFMISDILIILSILLVPGKTIDDVVYGYIAVIVFSVSLDYMLIGRKSSVQIMVFSDRYAEIADYINKVMDRGVTALNAVGWYSQQDKKVLVILVKRSEMSLVTDYVKRVDPRAFVSITPVKNVYGEGFEEIKSGLKLRKEKDDA